MDMKSFGRGTAGVPTQTFASNNLIGTPVPQLGAVGVVPTATNIAGGGSKLHVALVVAALVVGGYLLHHWFFEK